MTTTTTANDKPAPATRATSEYLKLLLSSTALSTSMYRFAR
jgi:hypothetical protein